MHRRGCPGGAVMSFPRWMEPDALARSLEFRQNATVSTDHLSDRLSLAPDQVVVRVRHADFEYGQRISASTYEAHPEIIETIVLTDAWAAYEQAREAS